MNNKKISVIVPVYNTGIMLNKCVDSILKQKLKDIEVILIDDGSSDESGKICDRYADIDARVKVLHKKNEGVSAARNDGIKIAEGEYIGFVDSDDWISEDMFLDMYRIAQNSQYDIVMCDAVTVRDNEKDEIDTIRQLKHSCCLTHCDFTPTLLLEMAGAVWRCIYKRKLIDSFEIRFPINIKLSEDRIFNIYAMGFSDSMYYIKKGYYKRYVRNGSAVHKYHDNMIDMAKNVYYITMRALNLAWKGDIVYKKEYEKQILNMCYSAINMVFYKDSPLSLKQKIMEIKRICQWNKLEKIIRDSKHNDIRARLIANKNVIMLSCLAIILNKKHCK